MKGKGGHIPWGLLLVAAGLLLTAIAVKEAYVERGSLQYGGEWLILPLILMLAEMARSVGDAIRFLLGTGGDDDDEQG